MQTYADPYRTNAAKPTVFNVAFVWRPSCPTVSDGGHRSAAMIVSQLAREISKASDNSPKD